MGNDDKNKKKPDLAELVLEEVSGLYDEPAGGKKKEVSDPSMVLQMPDMPADIPTADPTTVLKLDESASVEAVAAPVESAPSEGIQLTSAADASTAVPAASSEGGIELGGGDEGIVLESHSHAEPKKVEAAPVVEEAAPAAVEAAPEPATEEAPAEALPAFEFSNPEAVVAAAEPSEPVASPEPSPSIEFSATPTQQVSASSSAEPSAPIEPASHAEAEAEMPYLFGKELKKPGFDPMLSFGRVIGDAIVPGGAANAPDLDTLKQYLMLREQDVVALSQQLHTAIDQVRVLNNMLFQEQSKCEAYEKQISDQKAVIDEFESRKELELDAVRAENEELRAELKEKSEQTKLMEFQVKEALQEIDNLKDRVRMDIRRIRVREKELENRLEIIKKDSEHLILSRETKIIELKRKIDTLEFNMDLVKEQYEREKMKAEQHRKKLIKATVAFKNAEDLMGKDIVDSADNERNDPDKTVVLKSAS